MLHTDNEAFIWANLLWESGNLPLELRRKTSRRNLLIVGVRTRERRANKEWPQLRLSPVSSQAAARSRKVRLVTS